MYDEDHEMSKKRNNGYQERKDADILYNLQMRPSYDQIPGQQPLKVHKKSVELEIFEPSEFIPLEYHDSDVEDDIGIFITDLNDIKLYQKIV